MNAQPDAYANAGIRYDLMDPFKVAAQEAAGETVAAAKLEQRFGIRTLEWTRGESAFLFEFTRLARFKQLFGFLRTMQALVIEGLGTKSLVADAMEEALGRKFYARIARCALAMIVNDLITVGALPVVSAMYLAAGSSDWFKDEPRWRALVVGWQRACEVARCVWGPGETPTLKDIILPGTVELSGAALGIVRKPSHLIRSSNIQEGDAIILFGSSGIHANGLSLARKIASQLPRGYLTLVPEDGRTYGEVLLDPTIIYVRLMEELQDLGVDIHYAMNITGHGLRKIMRAHEPWSYIVTRLPKPQPIFEFIRTHNPDGDEPISEVDLYGNLNMGCGFAVCVRPHDVTRVLTAAQECGIEALDAGYVEEGRKRVVLEPINLTFEADSLQVR